MVGKIIAKSRNAPYDVLTPAEERAFLGPNYDKHWKSDGPKIHGFKEGRLDPRMYNWSKRPTKSPETIVYRHAFDIQGSLEGHTPEGLAKIAREDGIEVEDDNHEALMIIFNIPEKEYRAALL